MPTLLQLKYAVACARTCSVTKAASELYTSASNLSKMIKGLESELGYTIFTRTHDGIYLTLDGEEFLEHVKIILGEFDKLENLKKQHNTENSFIVTYVFNPFCIVALNQMINAHPQKAVQYHLLSCNHEDCLEKVKNHESDVGVTSIPSALEEAFAEHLELLGLDYQVLGKSEMCLRVRKGHPILKAGIIDFQKLTYYPYVTADRADEAINLRVTVPYLLSMSKKALENCGMIICNSRMARDEILHNTDAFSFGAFQPLSYGPSTDIVQIPIDGSTVTMYATTSPGTQKAEETEEFIQIIKKLINEKEGISEI